MLSNRKKLFIRYNDEDLPSGGFSFDAAEVDDENEAFRQNVERRLQDTDSVGKVKIKKGDESAGVSLPSQTDVVKTLASGFIRNRKLAPVLKELQEKSFKDLTFGFDDSKESNEQEKKIASTLNIYLTDPGNLVVFLRKLCSKDGPATDLFLDHLKKRVLKETYTDESENIIRGDLRDGLSIGQIYTIRMPDWIVLALAEFGIQNFYPYLEAKIFSYFEDIGFDEEFINAKENLVREEKDRAEKEKEAQNKQENNQTKTGKSALAGGNGNQSSSQQSETDESQEEDQKEKKDAAKDSAEDDKTKDPNDPTTPDKEKNNKAKTDNTGQAPTSTAPSTTSSSTAPVTKSTENSPQTNTPNGPQTVGGQAEPGGAANNAEGGLNPVPTLSPEEVAAKQAADAQEEDDYYKSQGYTGKQDFINKNTRETYTRNPDGTISDNDLANLGRGQGRARAFTKFKNADGSFQRIVLPATPGRSGEISQNDLEKPELEYLAKKLGRGFKTPSLATPKVNPEYGQDIIDEYKSTGQVSKGMELAGAALAAGQAATDPSAATGLLSQAAQYATKAAQRAKAFRESTELLKSLKRRRIMGAIFSIISAIAPIVLLFILIFGIMATTAYVYCKPVENIRNTIELALGVAAPGATAAATAIGAGIDVSEGKAPELALKSPLRVILEKNVCKYINDCSADQSANTISSDIGAGVLIGAGDVPCLVAPRTGVFANPKFRAFLRGVAQAENNGKYTGSNSQGCFGKFQFCPGGSYGYVAGRPDGIGGTFPPDPSQMSPVQQDLAFVLGWNGEASFRSPGFDINELVRVLDTQGIDAAITRSNQGNSFTIDGVTRTGFCGGWTPLCLPSQDSVQGKTDLIKGTYNAVLAEEQAGKCGSVANAQIENPTKKLANYDTFDPGSIINPFQPINADAQGTITIAESKLSALQSLESSGKITYDKTSGFQEARQGLLQPITVDFIINVANAFDEIRLTSLRRFNNSGSSHDTGYGVDFGYFKSGGKEYAPLDVWNGRTDQIPDNVEAAKKIISTGAVYLLITHSKLAPELLKDPRFVRVDSEISAYGQFNTNNGKVGLMIDDGGHYNHYHVSLRDSGSVSPVGTATASSSTNSDCPIDPCGAQTGSNINVSVSSGDQYVAAVLAILESPTLQGRLDVAQVIANRVANNFGGYGTSVRAQAFASGQFEPFFNSISRDEIQDEASAVAALQKKGYSAEQARSALKEFLAATQDPVKTAESESKIKNFVYFNGTSQYAFKQPQDFLRQDGENFFGNGWYNDNTNYKQASIATIFSGVKVSSVSKPSTQSTEQNLQNYLAGLSLSIPVYAAPSRPADYSSVSAAHKDFLGEIARLKNDSFYKEADFTELVSIDGQSVNKKAQENLTKMRNAAASQGVVLNIVSGFRSYNDQVGTFFNPSSSVSNPIPDSALFDDSYQVGSVQYQNSRNAYSLRAQKSAPPGYSEHHTGLALDFNSVEGSYWGTIQGQNAYNWLKQNARTYGFTQSFPESSGDRFEQWHWRYDGTSGSPAINEYKGSGDTSATSTINCTTTSSGTGGATTYTGTFINPAPGTVFTSPYGTRVHPITGVTKLHGGVDLAGPIGTPILAAAAGKVVNVGFEANGFGNYIVILHEGATRQGTETLYAHLNSTSVKEGDNVTQGQVIGELGNTGGSTGPHLHFELLQADVPRDPCTKLLGVCG